MVKYFFLKKELFWPFFGCSVALTFSLYLDIRLVSWYDGFYQSIKAKDFYFFIDNVLIFLIIVVLNCVTQAFIVYIQNYLDAKLKINFSKTAYYKNQFIAGCPSNFNQKIIDDSTLAAEKFSSLGPYLIFNIAKAIVFLYLMYSWLPNGGSDWMSTLFLNPLVASAICFFLVQTVISGMYAPLVNRSEILRRYSENKFRISLLNAPSDSKFKLAMEGYLSRIISIRKHLAFKNFIYSVLLGLISATSYVIPFFVLFDLYFQDLLSFGELMKLSASFGTFQGSTIYIISNMKEWFKGYSAFKRVMS
ncbi:hypothetical protein DPM18_04685 [Polynucleobacter paneuropaeus]|uniref:hypothetical protein n=1 Tax=Polynucleobacter paneuropaeus TaxID=2527775 RepID=UPI000DBF3877|nr:hypothetical protein [Polynucleobacter paneuropaeus]AWW46164.1 hypothetical protein DPM18_04685 [Polynucleobacter paneuropaeus]